MKEAHGSTASVLCAGVVWLGALIYPDYCEYDLQEVVTEYYKLFYECDLTREMYDELVLVPESERGYRYEKTHKV